MPMINVPRSNEFDPTGSPVSLVVSRKPVLPDPSGDPAGGVQIRVSIGFALTSKRATEESRIIAMVVFPRTSLASSV